MKKSVLIILCFVFVLGCKSPDARIPVSKKSGSFIIESVERNIELNAKEHNIIKALIEQQKDSSFITSKNGFWYKYNFKIEGDSIKPQFGDLVNFNYNIKDLDGTIIYTKEELKTQTYAMDQQELFTGLREGLKLMKAGETVTFLFPSQKAYGYYGDENKIGTNIPLMCQVTVNSIIKKQTN
jgi:gliding motility-associated peptidyl-prolyl isomerase